MWRRLGWSSWDSGPTGDALARFVAALGRRDLETLHEIAAQGRELEGGPPGKLRHLSALVESASVEWLEATPAAAARIHFTGRIEHDGPAELAASLRGAGDAEQSRVKIPCSFQQKFPVPGEKISCSVAQGIWLQGIELAGPLNAENAGEGPEFQNSL